MLGYVLNNLIIRAPLSNKSKDDKKKDLYI